MRPEALLVENWICLGSSLLLCGLVYRDAEPLSETRVQKTTHMKARMSRTHPQYPASRMTPTPPSLAQPAVSANLQGV